ncbi:MAG: tRNA (adenosine(37)-N6)-dimethylallyltransferase MiaA [Lachnospiraceae bacterium]|nr:tRNA (adenosine(37)-N6)-dimethylallyltransferase MiaA [Lachnospiraceae bacterium]
MKDKLLVIAGPTAAGKTAVAVSLAGALDGEVISADSMQVYRYMDIGSAKVKKEEMRGIRHHMIDILDPGEDFNVYLFKNLATEAVKDITGRGRLPILAGGTGFYIRALLYDADFEEERGDKAYREELLMLSKQKGADFVYDLLREADPEYADSVHANNIKRVISALEFYHSTGKKLSRHNSEQRAKDPKFDLKYYVLDMPRDILYERIDERVDGMIKAGLVDEVRRLKDMNIPAASTSMQGIGYKEMMMHLEGKISREEAIELIKKNSRHYAKRQLTWFRREKDAIFIDIYNKTIPEITEMITEDIKGSTKWTGV